MHTLIFSFVFYSFFFSSFFIIIVACVAWALSIYLSIYMYVYTYLNLPILSSVCKRYKYLFHLVIYSFIVSIFSYSKPFYRIQFWLVSQAVSFLCLFRFPRG